MTSAAVWALVRRFWWALPMTGLAIALFVTRASLSDTRQTLRNERAAWTATIADADLRTARLEAGYERRNAEAAQTYASGLAARAPIIVRSTDTVREYAQTDAGRARCLGADRVRGIDALDAEFASASTSAGSSDGSMPRDADAAPAGR